MDTLDALAVGSLLYSVGKKVANRPARVVADSFCTRHPGNHHMCFSPRGDEDDGLEP